MKSTLKYTYLADNPELVPLCAKWAIEAWGKYNPTMTLEKRIKSFTEHCNKNLIPLTFIAWINDQPVGMASLRTHADIRQDLTPWFASLYVDDKFQKQGIGQELVKKVQNEAIKLGYKTLHLLTYDESLPEWYSLLGWREVSKDILFSPVTIMEISLN